MNYDNRNLGAWSYARWNFEETRRFLAGHGRGCTDRENRLLAVGRHRHQQNEAEDNSTRPASRRIVPSFPPVFLTVVFRGAAHSHGMAVVAWRHARYLFEYICEMSLMSKSGFQCNVDHRHVGVE
jgi:hypothetical protein